MKQPLRRRLGIGTGVIAGLAVSLWLHAPGQAHLLAPGPMNTGHDALACSSCHVAAPGSVRQQLQAIAHSWVRGDAGPVDLGFRAVTNAQCQSCHERPDDRHPVFRFLEPRFADARTAIHPELCTSCHREHDGTRVTLADGTYCSHCHADLDVAQERLDTSHRTLVAAKRWDTCLGCHDYHGNHGLEPPTRLADAIAPAAIQTYLHGGASPYPAPIIRAHQPEVTKP
jgi:hypothetical protein